MSTIDLRGLTFMMGQLLRSIIHHSLTRPSLRLSNSRRMVLFLRRRNTIVSFVLFLVPQMEWRLFLIMSIHSPSRPVLSMGVVRLFFSGTYRSWGCKRVRFPHTRVKLKREIIQTLPNCMTTCSSLTLFPENLSLPHVPATSTVCRTRMGWLSPAVRRLVKPVKL